MATVMFRIATTLGRGIVTICAESVRRVVVRISPVVVGGST